jgi:hypothetical protein
MGPSPFRAKRTRIRDHQQMRRWLGKRRTPKREPQGYERRRTKFLPPVPEDHRTDWGEDFVLQLDDALAASPPPSLTRDATELTTSRGGEIRLRLARADMDDAVVVQILEDEAWVSAGDTERHFKPGDRASSWIPEAVKYVSDLLGK